MEHLADSLSCAFKPAAAAQPRRQTQGKKTMDARNSRDVMSPVKGGAHHHNGDHRDACDGDQRLIEQSGSDRPNKKQSE
ncbi:MAG TPA: hypothetical protein PLN91_16020 [Rhodanobacteraceae bacterium]|nr:hypothetical protein [Comamonas sp.]HOV59387.1 hypothetical protein [Rhodanobacteraceae bacterium]